jgi:hypothetical protein
VRALSIVVVVIVAAVTVRAVNDSTEPQAQALSRLSLVSVACYGKERWTVKTLSDDARATVRFDPPVKAGVADLWSFGRAKGSPALGSKRADPEELTLYKVRGRLVKARFVDDAADSRGKGGGDRDYHLVIAASRDKSAQPKTMIVEFPDPNCVKAADPVPSAMMADARATFEKVCGHPPKHSFYDLSGTATITGVGFFDRPHGDGRAEHGFELHPVLTFKSSNCKWGPKSPSPDPRMLNP